MNGFPHLGEFTFILGASGMYKFLMKMVFANRIAPDGTLRSAALHLGLYCLCMSHKKDARLK